MRFILTVMCVLFFMLQTYGQESEKAESIVAEYLKFNGISNFSQFNSLKFHGISERSFGKMSFRTWLKPPNKYRIEVDMGGSSVFVQAFDGKKGWEINPYSPMEGAVWLNEDRLSVISMNFFPSKLAVVKEQGYKLTYNGETTYNQKPVWHLILSTPDSLDYDFFIEQESYQLVKYTDWIWQITGEDKVKVEVEPSDYRDFNGINLPYIFTHTYNGTLFKKDFITAYEVNISVDVSFPSNLPVKPKTFGFNPDHQSEKKLLAPLAPKVVEDAQILDNPDGRKLKAATLSYEGTHRGEHPDWIYDTTYSITKDFINEKSVWKLTEHVASNSQNEQSSTIVQATDLQIIRDYGGFYEGDFTYTVEDDLFVMSAVNRHTGESIRDSLPFNNQIVTLGVQDLYIATLPLKLGYVRNYNLIYGREVRPFQLNVKGKETITTKAGTFETYVVELNPIGGKRELQSVYYVMEKEPHYVVRKKYIVFPQTTFNPETNSKMYKSMGSEDLTSIKWVD